MRVREVNFYGSKSSKIILEDKFKCYLEVLYEDYKSIYVYDKELEKLTEFTSTNDLTYNFLVDEHRKIIYQYYKLGDLVIVEEVSLYNPIEIFVYKIGFNYRIVDLFIADGYIFMKYKNAISNIEGIIYSIEEHLVFVIDDVKFLEGIGHKVFFTYNDISYMAIEEKYYEGTTIDLNRVYDESRDSTNTIILYDINELVDEIIREEDVSRNILIESDVTNYVTLLGFHDNKIVVFNKGEKNRLIYFSVDDNIGFKTVPKEIYSMVSKGELILISESTEKKEVINENNEIIYSFKGIDEVERVEVRALVNNRVLVYSNNYGEKKNIKIYDIYTGDEKIFKSDFLMIDRYLV